MLGFCLPPTALCVGRLLLYTSTSQETGTAIIVVTLAQMDVWERQEQEWFGGVIKMNSGSRMVESACPCCGSRLDTSKNVDGDRVPGPGDISMCFRCGMPLMFRQDLALRPMLKEEMDVIKRTDPEAWATFSKAQVALNQFWNKRSE